MCICHVLQYSYLAALGFESTRIGEMAMITLHEGDRWICTNSVCRAEMVVVKHSESGTGTNPRCSCGTLLKKPYHRPTLRRLTTEEAESFLAKHSNEMLVISTKQMRNDPLE